MSIFKWVADKFFGVSGFGNQSGMSTSSTPEDVHSTSSWSSSFDDSLSTSRFSSDNDWSDSSTTVNPATGLPMIGGIGGVDVGGNTFGSDSSTSFDSFSSTSSFDDSWSSSSSSFDDSWSSSSFSSFDS